MKHQLILILHGEPESLIQVQNDILGNAKIVDAEIVKMEIKRIQEEKPAETKKRYY